VLAKDVLAKDVSASVDDAWAIALDELENEVYRDPADRRASTWMPPTHLGLLPATLSERARELLVAQEEVIGALKHAQIVTGSHISALRSVPSLRDSSQSVYFDSEG
jgi:hypothetical protein